MTEKRCLGITRNFHRCSRNGEWRFFCNDHKKQPLIWLSFLIFTVLGSIASIYSVFFSSSHDLNDEINKRNQILRCVFEYGVHLSGAFEKIMYLESICDNDPIRCEAERDRMNKNFKKIFFHINESKFFLDQIGLNINAMNMINEAKKFADMEKSVNRVGDLIRIKIDYAYGKEAKYFFNIGAIIGGVGYRAMLAKKYSIPELAKDYKERASKINEMLNELYYDIRINTDVQDIDSMLQNIEVFYANMSDHFVTN